MGNIDLDPILVLLGALLAIGFIACAYITSTTRKAPKNSLPEAVSESVTFLFDGDTLVDVSKAAQRLAGGSGDFRDIAEKLAHRFPDLPQSLSNIAKDVQILSHLPGDSGYLHIKRSANRTALTLHDPDTNASDRHSLLSASSRLDLLDSVVKDAPVAIWTTSDQGHVVERNAYFGTLEELAEGPPFDLGESPFDLDKGPRRLWIEDSENNTRKWYDITTRKTGPASYTHYAINADAIVNAEVAQRNFVQTLTKTFAQLSIGLAIFDRKRQLALFNPALIDLTTVPADFLSARPSLNSFFDQLRDRQIMPEPRNYRNWRDQLSDMIAAAQDGIYCETWTLPSGLTYRISGKPHPDGAVAFLFEDISAEISLTRRFRAELELSQSVIDSLDTALAVFSRNGTLTFCNTRFRELWKCSPDESFIEMTVFDASRIWQELCEASPVWGELRNFVTTVDERAEWVDQVVHIHEGPLSVEAAPLSGGSSVVRFTLLTPSAKSKAQQSTVPDDS
ncbi:PAS-domain containing protein [Primorskyibacter sp. S187A]|uniref:PAS-domain containing protein n=1 Tax=Primorskyibacter sp. S187A TaxID=3415130 RepID=UPI003C7B81E5